MTAPNGQPGPGIPCGPCGPCDPFVPGAPSRPSRPSLPSRPFVPFVPGVPGSGVTGGDEEFAGGDEEFAGAGDVELAPVQSDALSRYSHADPSYVTTSFNVYITVPFHSPRNVKPRPSLPSLPSRPFTPSL